MNSQFHAVLAAGMLLSQPALPPRSWGAPADPSEINNVDAQIRRNQQREAARQNGLSFVVLPPQAQSLQVSNLLSWVSRQHSVRTDPKLGMRKQPFEFALIRHMIQFATVDVALNFKGFTVEEVRTNASLAKIIDQQLKDSSFRFPSGITNAASLSLLMSSLDAQLDLEIGRQNDSFRKKF